MGTNAKWMQSNTKFVQIKRRKLVEIRSSGICLCGKRCKSKCAHLTTFIDRTFVIESTNRICIYWILPCHRTIIAATGEPMLATLPKTHNMGVTYIVRFTQALRKKIHLESQGGFFSFQNVFFFYFEGWLWPILACQRCFQLVAHGNHVCWTGRK